MPPVVDPRLLGSWTSVESFVRAECAYIDYPCCLAKTVDFPGAMYTFLTSETGMLELRWSGWRTACQEQDCPEQPQGVLPWNGGETGSVQLEQRGGTIVSREAGSQNDLCFSAFVVPGEDGEEELVLQHGIVFSVNFTGPLRSVGIHRVCTDATSVRANLSCHDGFPLFHHNRRCLGCPVPMENCYVVTTRLHRRVAPSGAPNETGQSNGTLQPVEGAAQLPTEAPHTKAANLAVPLLVSALLLAFSLLLFLFFCCFWRHRRSKGKRQPAEVRAAVVDVEAPLDASAPRPKKRSEEEMTKECLKGRLSVKQLAALEHWGINADAVKSTGEGALRHGWLHGTSPVAVRELKRSSVPLEAMLNEVHMWRRARHQNTVLFHGAVVGDEGSSLQIVLEWVQGCRFSSYVPKRRESGNFREQVLSLGSEAFVHEHTVLLDVVRAMQHLHCMLPPLFHLGLHPRSVLVEGRVPPLGKISDFSNGRIGDKDAEEGAVLEWQKTDVRDFGKLAIFAITGKEAGDRPRLRAKDLGAEQVGSLAGVVHVAKSCVARKPEQRPNFREVYLAISDLKALANQPVPAGHRFPLSLFMKSSQ